MTHETLQYAAVVWEPDDLVEVRCLPPAPGRLRVWTPAGGIGGHIDRMTAENAAGVGIYAGVLPRTEAGGGRAEHTDGGRIVWIDCDHVPAAEALAAIQDANVPAPAMAVDSGHGAHIYWKLDAKLPRAEHTRLLKAAHAWLVRETNLGPHLDAKTQEPARILRLPGFINSKEPAAPCRIIHYAPDAICGLGDWAAALLAYAPEPERPAYRPTFTAPAGDRDRAYAVAAMNDELQLLATRVEGQRNRQLNISAVKLGELVAGGVLDEREVRAGLWDASQACGLKEDETRRSIESGLRHGMKNPRRAPEQSAPDIGADLSGILNQAPRRRSGLQPAEEVLAVDVEEEDDAQSRFEIPEDPGPFPQRLLQVPGFISEVVDFCLSVAFSPQPILALGGAIALQAVLAARKIADATDSRTNLYIIGIAPGSAGKDRPLKVNREILFRAGSGDLEGSSEFASDSGLLAAIAHRPAILFQVDEIGRMLRSCGDAKSAHLWNISSQLVRLFSLADSVYKGKAYADSEKNREIIQPCASLFGVTVGHHYYESLTRENLIDGLVARLLVLEGDERPIPQKGAAIRPPEHLLDHVRWWKVFNPSGNMAGVYPEPVIVPESPEVEILFSELAAVASSLPANDDIGRTLWGRANEKARRLALVYAASRDKDNLCVDIEAAQWAYDLAVYTTRRMLCTAWDHVADNAIHKNKQRILRMLKKSPGGKMTRNQLARCTQDLRGKERDEIIVDLAEAGLLRVETVAASKIGGRPITVYRLA
jgi:hypothetical protein